MAKEVILIDRIQKLGIEEDRLPIFEALALLEDVNKQIHHSGSCRIRIYNRRNRLLYTLDLQFPFKEPIEEIIEAHIHAIEQDKPATKGKGMMTKRVLPINVQTSRAPTRISRLVKRAGIISIPLLSFIFFINVSFDYFFVPSEKIETKEMKKQEDWDQLLQKKAYFEAIENYPQKQDELVDYLVEQKEHDWLQKINERFPSENAQFDLAFLAEDWQKVIGQYPTELSERRQVMLALAYLELDMLAEAELLNQRLDSQELARQLGMEYQKQALACLKERKFTEAKQFIERINIKEQRQMINAYMDQAMIINDFIELYDTNDEPQNRSLWQERLENLGDKIEE